MSIEKEIVMNKFGIFMNFWENDWNADHVTYIKKAAKLGFDILEFQAQPLLEMSDSKITEIKKVADEYSIELTYSLGLDKKYDISSPDEAVRTGGIEYLKNIMKKVKLQQGKIISGVSYAGWGVPDTNETDKRKLRENSLKSMREISKMAEDMDITYAVEAVNRFEGVVLNTAAEAVSYVEELGCRKVGILLDTYHMNIEEFSFKNAIETAGRHLVGFHTGENNRSAPGRGHLDWDEIFKALSDIGYTGPIVSEPFVVSGGQVGKDIYVWRNLLEDVSENALDKEAKFLLEFQKEMVRKYS